MSYLQESGDMKKCSEKKFRNRHEKKVAKYSLIWQMLSPVKSIIIVSAISGIVVLEMHET